MQNFRFDSVILLHSNESAPDAALVRDDDEFVAVGFQTPQCLWHTGENLYLLWIGTVIRVAHDSAVAIHKDSG